MLTQEPACIIINENQSIGVEKLCIPDHYKDDVENIIIPYGLILDRTEALATQIFNEFGNEPLVCLCVLKGGYRFFADLTRKIQDKNRTNGNGKSLPMKLDFIKYRFNDANTNDDDVIFQYDDELQKIFQKNVLIIEDCIHGGKKIKSIIQTLNNYLPKNIKCCSLLIKRPYTNDSYIPDYVGFSIPEKFVVGYALDLNEHFRDLEHLCFIKESSRPKYMQRSKTQ